MATVRKVLNDVRRMWDWSMGREEDSSAMVTMKGGYFGL